MVGKWAVEVEGFDCPSVRYFVLPPLCAAYGVCKCTCTCTVHVRSTLGRGSDPHCMSVTFAVLCAGAAKRLGKLHYHIKLTYGRAYVEIGWIQLRCKVIVWSGSTAYMYKV
jgi:hypothetical protein